MDLATLSIIIGVWTVVGNAYGVLQPRAFGEIVLRFPRNYPAGVVLTLIATAWFVWILQHETLADFDVHRTKMQVIFAAVGVAACLFLKDFLAVRGLAVIMLLLAKTVVDTARFHDSDWRILLVTFAYIWVIMGMWFTVSPWRLRDILEWTFGNEQRIRLFSGVRMALGALLVLLGLTAFRGGA